MMGSDHHYPDEAPAHKVRVDGFWIDRHPVTNAEFARFVHETKHVTVAERPADPADYPGARPELLVPASTVFRQPPHRVDLGNHYNWWIYVPGADWRHPRGRAVRSGVGPTTRWSRSPGTTSRPMRRGPARSCPPKPSGSWPAEAAWTAPPTPGGRS